MQRLSQPPPAKPSDSHPFIRTLDRIPLQFFFLPEERVFHSILAPYLGQLTIRPATRQIYHFIGFKVRCALGYAGLCPQSDPVARFFRLSLFRCFCFHHPGMGFCS